MTYVIRVSDESERSALTAKVLLIFYMGMLFGPALNYPLSLLGRYQFGPLTLASLNAPGFLMVFTLLLAVLFLHLFFEEPLNIVEEFEVDEATKAQDARFCGLGKYRPLVTSFTLMCVIMLQFLVQFNQITMETIVTPMSHAFYGFGQLQNSLIYAAITLVFFVWFGAIIFLSRCIQDRVLVVIGTVFFGVTFIGAVAIFYSQPAPDTYVLPFYLFALLLVFAVSGIPFFLSSMSSLFSKLVGDKRIQGMGQSMLSASNSLANVLGPIVCGAILPRADIIFALLLGVWGMIMFLLLVRWNAFRTSSVTPEEVLTETIVNDK